MEKNSKIIIIVLAIICLGLSGTVGYLVLNNSQEKCTSKVPETNSKNENEYIEERPAEDDYYEEEVKLVSIEEVKKYTSKDIKYVYLDIPCEDDSCVDPVSHSIVICDQKEIDNLLNIFDKIEKTEQSPETGLITANLIRFITKDDKSINVVLAGEDEVWVNGTEFKLKNAQDYFYSFDGTTLTK